MIYKVKHKTYKEAFQSLDWINCYFITEKVFDEFSLQNGIFFIEQGNYIQPFKIHLVEKNLGFINHSKGLLHFHRIFNNYCHMFGNFQQISLKDLLHLIISYNNKKKSFIQKLIKSLLKNYRKYGV